MNCRIAENKNKCYIDKMEANEETSVSTAMVRRSRKKAGKFPLGAIFSKISKRSLLLALAVIALTGLVYYFKGLFIAATVNGKPISRLSLIQKMEKQSGKQALDSLIVEILILQEAKKQNINVGPDEINTEIKKIEDSLTAQGQNLDQLLSFQGLSREDLRKQIELQKTAVAIVKKDIKVTDEEIESYLETSKESFPEGTDSGELREQTKKQLEQQKIDQEIQSLVQDLREKAKINYFLNL